LFIKIIPFILKLVLLFDHIGVVGCFVVMTNAAASTLPY